MACARSMAFWMMSTLSSSVGAMFTAASVMISASGWFGTSMMKQWLIRRAVRMPSVLDTTAPISSSVCRLPFISASAAPQRTCSTALAAESWLCSAIDDRHAADVEVPARRDLLDARRRTDQDRRNQAELGGLDGAFQRDLVARMGDRGLGRRQLPRRLDQTFVFHVLRAGRLTIRSSGIAHGLLAWHAALPWPTFGVTARRLAEARPRRLGPHRHAVRSPRQARRR